jgi:hypothetical protein
MSEIESVEVILQEITEPMKHPALGQYVDSRNAFLRSAHRHSAVITAETTKWFESKWSKLESRLEIVPGKETLSTLRGILQDRYAVSLTESRIIRSFKEDEIPQDLLLLLRDLENYRKTKAPGVAA